jgi:hypothetical protein
MSQNGEASRSATTQIPIRYRNPDAGSLRHVARSFLSPSSLDFSLALVDLDVSLVSAPDFAWELPTGTQVKPTVKELDSF